MKKNTPKNRARQARLNKRQTRKRGKNNAASRPTVPNKSHHVSYSDFCRLAKEEARPGDRLRTIYASGELAKALGIEAPGDELHPVEAQLVRPRDKT